MSPDTLNAVVDLLYCSCFVAIPGLCVIVSVCSSDRNHGCLLQRNVFYALCCAILIWQLTLFAEPLTRQDYEQLWLGRVNFASVAFASYFAYVFVIRVAKTVPVPSSRWPLWLRVETVILATVTLFTPLVDAAERVAAGQAISTYGPLFPCYILHVLGYLAAALALSFSTSRTSNDLEVSRQLQLIWIGMIATGVVGSVTNILLPYVFGDFRLCDIGALSTLFFLLAIAHAVFLHGLFDVRPVLRKTLVYGILSALVLAAYSSAVLLITQYFIAGATEMKQFAVLVIAFSFDPIRRLVEAKTDRMLFGGRNDRARPGAQRHRGE